MAECESLSNLPFAMVTNRDMGCHVEPRGRWLHPFETEPRNSTSGHLWIFDRALPCTRKQGMTSTFRFASSYGAPVQVIVRFCINYNSGRACFIIYRRFFLLVYMIAKSYWCPCAKLCPKYGWMLQLGSVGCDNMTVVIACFKHDGSLSGVYERCGMSHRTTRYPRYLVSCFPKGHFRVVVELWLSIQVN
jgi:hypothetical protein